MQRYKRKITYFYQYQDGVVGSTAGFMKLEIRGDKVKIIINIQEPLGLPYKSAQLYIYHEAGDHLAAIKVDTIESIDGVLTYQNKTDWQNVFHTERDLYTFDGIAVVYNDRHYYIGDFADKDRRSYELVKRELKPAIAKMVPVVEVVTDAGDVAKEKLTVDNDWNAEDKLTVNNGWAMEEKLTMDNNQSTVVKEDMPEYDKNEEPEREQMFEQKMTEKMSDHLSAEETFGNCANCPYQEKRKEQQDDRDAFEKMIQNYPKLPMYGATELFDCVRIHPRDIGKLDMRNWKLGVNSFLTHGFYTYQYLLLGKLRFEDGSHRCIIGVPGVFSNREKYLANMFGFDQFIPVKKTGIKTGEFGYWIVEIVPCL